MGTTTSCVSFESKSPIRGWGHNRSSRVKQVSYRGDRRAKGRHHGSVGLNVISGPPSYKSDERRREGMG